VINRIHGNRNREGLDRPRRGREIGSTDGDNGSACAGRARDLDAGKLTLILRYRIADARGRKRSQASPKLPVARNDLFQVLCPRSSRS